MSKEKCMNKKLHPYYRTGIYGWIGEEVDDNDYIFCPICGELLGANYWDYQAENDGDNKCPKCKQELDYSEIYDFEDTCYYQQLVEIKTNQISDLEPKLAESEKEIKEWIAVRDDKNNVINKQTKKINQLKQQLAEKEKEITQRLVIQERDYTQDKISFCIEQLEKVKAELVNKVSPVNLSYTEYVQEVFAKLNNQIKQLKEME